MLSRLAWVLFILAVIVPLAAGADEPIGPNPSSTTKNYRQVYGSRTVAFTQIDPFRWTATITISTSPIPSSTLPPAALPSTPPQVAIAGATAAATPTPLPDMISQAQTALNRLETVDMVALEAYVDAQLQAGQLPNTSSQQWVNAHNSLEALGELATTIQAAIAAGASLGGHNASDVATLLSNISKYYGRYEPLFNGAAVYSLSSVANCGGLQGAGQLVTVTLNLVPTDPLATQTTTSYVVQVTCAPTIDLAPGAVFTLTGAYTYSANSPPVLPGASAPPTAIITQSPIGKRPLRTEAAAFAHFALPFWQNAAGGAYITLIGAPVIGSSASAGNGTPIEGGIGLTYGLYDHFFVTGGGWYGNVTVPQSGYSVGSTVATGASIPTTAVPTFVWFVGISGRLP